MEFARPVSVDALARLLAAKSQLPHSVLVDIARRAIAEESTNATEHGSRLAREFESALIGTVVNATGVLLHTNLGRAPQPLRSHGEEAFRASNLEFDLTHGRRGSRYKSISGLLRILIGSPAAIVVNNNAAAILLVASALAEGRGIAISRGESVEIGGGFRIPEVIQQSGARLVDVGTTNKTYAHDYEEAIRQSDVSLIMSIHSSNFEITGFVHRPSTRELVGLGRPLVVDIGSGLLDRTCPWLTSRNHSAPEWLCGEPAARQSLEDGAALVIFSGDKLLGGPQCGIIAGDSELVARCASHPLMRALRPGAETLQSLQSVLLAYAARDAVTEIPFWSMVAAPLATLKERANAVASAAGRGTVQEVSSLVGAGSAPSAKLRSFALVLEGDHAVELRRNSPPVIARVDQNKTYCDLRSVAPDDDTVIVAALRALTS